MDELFCLALLSLCCSAVARKDEKTLDVKNATFNFSSPPFWNGCIINYLGTVEIGDCAVSMVVFFVLFFVINFMNLFL